MTSPVGRRPHAPGASERHRHGGHGWMMIACCLPMLAIAAVLVATGIASAGVLIGALACTAMMALMMSGMNRATATATATATGKARYSKRLGLRPAPGAVLGRSPLPRRRAVRGRRVGWASGGNVGPAEPEPACGAEDGEVGQGDGYRGGDAVE